MELVEFPASKYTAQLNWRRPNNSRRKFNTFIRQRQGGPAPAPAPATAPSSDTFLVKLFSSQSNVKPLVMRLLLRCSGLSLFFRNLIRSTRLEQQVLDLDKGEERSGAMSVLFHFLIIRFVRKEFSYQRAA